MPSPWKKPRSGSAFARLLSGLRPDRRGGSAGSLPVQTGFPTSLADLYVKNQSRLKKPSRSRKKHSDSSSSPISTVPSPSHGRDLPSPPTTDSISNRCRDGIGEETVSVDKKNYLRIELIGIMIIGALFLLAIIGEKLVVGISAIAFTLLLFDSVRPRLVNFVKPCPDARRVLNLDGRGLVSPLREESGIEIQSESAESEDSFQISLLSDEILVERTDLGQVEACNSKKKKKKINLLKKLFCRKHGKRKSKEEKLVSLDDSNSEKEIDRVDINEIKQDSNEIEASNLVMGELRGETVEQNCENKLGNSRILVFFSVVLFGLTGGKGVALVLTVSSFFFGNLVESAWRNRRRERIGSAGSAG